MDIEKYSGLLIPNKIVHYEYDKDGDFLEIFFQHREASAAIELTDNIILRFDWEKCVPLSLGIICFSRPLEPALYGKKHFALLVEHWPDEAIDKIWRMMRQPPLTEILKLRSYVPANADSIVPMTAMNRLPALAV